MLEFGLRCSSPLIEFREAPKYQHLFNFTSFDLPDFNVILVFIFIALVTISLNLIIIILYSSQILDTLYLYGLTTANFVISVLLPRK